MTLMTLEELGEPSYTDAPALSITGLTEEYAMERIGEIPQQWMRFASTFRALSKAQPATWGVVRGERGVPMRYTAGVEAHVLEQLPAGWETVTIPAQHYAIFSRHGNLADMQRMWPSIWQVWLPASGRKPLPGAMLEFYSAGWCPQNGGQLEIRVPIER